MLIGACSGHGALEAAHVDALRAAHADVCRGDIPVSLRLPNADQMLQAMLLADLESMCVQAHLQGSCLHAGHVRSAAVVHVQNGPLREIQLLSGPGLLEGAMQIYIAAALQPGSAKPVILRMALQLSAISGHLRSPESSPAKISAARWSRSAHRAHAGSHCCSVPAMSSQTCDPPQFVNHPIRAPKLPKMQSPHGLTRRSHREVEEHARKINLEGRAAVPGAGQV